MYADDVAIFAQALTKEQATSKLLPLFKDKNNSVFSSLPMMTDYLIISLYYSETKLAA